MKTPNLFKALLSSAALLMTFFGPVWGQAVDHQRLAQEAGCFTCHYLPPESSREPGSTRSTAESKVDPRLKKGAGKWCVSCHAMETMKQHPTGVKVTATRELPLEDGEYMSCLTCHSPHAAPVASEPWAPLAINPAFNDNYSTFLLTHPNNEGQLCSKCHPAGTDVFQGSMHSPKAFDNRNYAGSESCRACHLDIYDQWKLSPHARMTRKFRNLDNQQEIPVEDLGVPRERIAWVLGSHYVHRFVAEASGTLVVLPKIWDLNKKAWLPVTDYGWRSRYWLKQCAGCHTTGFSAENDSFAEAGVGCEACHGPGLNHIRTRSPEYITSLKSMTAERYEMICTSCHTSGIDNSGQYNFPVGYRPGDNLHDFFSGLTPKPGQTPENFTGDESYEDRRRQWEFLKTRYYLASGLTCDYCQNFRDIKTTNNSLYLTQDQYCLTCHTDRLDHPPESPGNNCIVCHQPTRHLNGRLSFHDHRLMFE
ncbi:MAG TPA: multiheme c-type cytochrome [Candidatus Rifleibacterium sp.]|nr:multiheme c-type cytochrome [Candidatus Rifleibacterium sp.]